MLHTRIHQTRAGMFGTSTDRLQISKVGNKEDPPKTSTFTREDQQQETNPSTQKKICHMVTPYSKGIGESFKNICRKYGIQVYFKGGKTIKNLLVLSKDKDNIKKKSNVIYWFKCDKIDREEEYIGESSRTFEERYKEHLKAPSPIH